MRYLDLMTAEVLYKLAKKKRKDEEIARSLKSILDPENKEQVLKVYNELERIAECYLEDDLSGAESCTPERAHAMIVELVYGEDYFKRIAQ